MKKQKRIIVIGGSAGSLRTVSKILSSLKNGKQASVFVAMHGSGDESVQLLEKKLSDDAFQVELGKEGESIEPGKVYLAPSDHHLMAQDGCVRINKGPRVNRSRPAIDLLFRSAAVAYGVKTIGVILSGLLSDGTAGLAAIKRCGGVTVAQDPDDALFGDMPRSAMEATNVDYVKPAGEIGLLLNRLVKEKVKTDGKIPEEILTENRLDLNKKSDITKMDSIGEKTFFSCPECGGPMWKVNDSEIPRYRCHTGHSLNTEGLMDGQSEEIEKTLRVALRTLEEKLQVQEKLAKSKNGERRDILEERITQAKSHIDRLRKLILDL